MFQSQTALTGQAHAPDPITHAPFAPPSPVRLTLRENVVLQWSAAGKTSWEIAQILQCSESAVNFHFCNIRRKFGVSSRSAALLKAVSLGLISLC